MVLFHSILPLFFHFESSIPEYVFDASSNTLSIKACPKEETSCSIEKTDYQKSGPFTSYKKIVIELGPTKIGNGAFSGSSSVEEINISSWVSIIGNPFCQSCTNLRKIYFSSPNQNYETDAFGSLYERESKSLMKSPTARTDVVIRDDTEKILTYAMMDLQAKYMKIPKSVKSIQGNSFYKSKIEKLEFEEGSNLIELGQLALTDMNSAHTIILPSSLETLGVECMARCIYLVNLSFPIDSHLLYIKSSALKENSMLERIILPNSTVSIGDNAFSSCSSLSRIVLSENLSVLSGSAFSGCGKIQEIIVPEANKYYTSFNGSLFSKEMDEVILIPAMVESFRVPKELKKVGQTALQMCERLVKLDVEKGHEKFVEDEHVLIEKSTMKGLAIVGGASEVNLPTGVKSLGPYFAFGCKKLTRVELPSGISSLGDYCFSSSSITSIILSDGLSSVGVSAFEGCSKLVNITFPKNGVIGFEQGTFIKCSSIEELIFDCNVSKIPYRFCRYCGAKKIEFRKDGFTSINQGSFEGMSRIESLTFPRSLQVLSTYSLTSGFKYINFPNGCGVKTVQSWALSWSSVISLTFGKELETIQLNAFAYCSNLQEIYIPIDSKLTDLSPVGIFSYCKSLKTFNVPQSVIKVSPLIFTGCTSLTSITSDQSKVFTSINGVLYDKRNDGLILVVCPPGLSNVNVAESVIGLGNECFYQCSKLVSISFPESSKFDSIGENVFFGCSSLSNIKIPRSVQEISSSAFEGCGKMQMVEFGSKSALEELGEGVFSGCKELNVIKIADCSSLRAIPDKCFEGCLKLTEVTLPKMIEAIGMSAFAECIGMKSIFLPNSLRQIGERAFAESGLSGTLLLPGSISNVGEDFLFGSKVRDVVYCGVNELKTDAELGQGIIVHVQPIYQWEKCLGAHPERDVSEGCYIMTEIPSHVGALSAIALQEVIIGDVSLNHNDIE